MRSVLIVKPGSMGDVIHALPVANSIHAAWPDCRITWIVDPRWAPLLEDHPAISRLVEFPREKFRGLSGAAAFVTWLRGLSGLRPDLAIDLQGLLRSAVMSRASRPDKVVGLSDAREGSVYFYHKTADVSQDRHAVDRYCRVLPLIGLELPAHREFFPGTHATGRVGISGEKPAVVLHPFARGAGKSIEDAALAALVESLQNHAELTVVGHGATSLSGVRNLCGKTSLRELMAILQRADFVISADSGPMHLAAALGTPVLGIHTWSDPSRVGPYAANAWVWQGGSIRRQNLAQTATPEQPFTEAAAREVGGFVARLLADGIPV